MANGMDATAGTFEGHTGASAPYCKTNLWNTMRPSLRGSSKCSTGSLHSWRRGVGPPGRWTRI
eukprot:827540-Prorocentrum_lima.AAC.1